MKRLITVFLVALGLVVPLAPAANAETVTFPCGPNGETYSVIMPAGIALDGQKCVGTLVIDGSVKIIGDGAFVGSKLTTVTISNSVTSIGSDAFRGCGFCDVKLTSVTIGNSVTSIGSSAFFNTSITSVTIPNSVTSIGSDAFESTQLTSVNIPNSVTSIGDYAF